MKLTYLSPSESWCKTAKSFTGPSRDRKISDYNLGTLFTYDHVEYENLIQLAQDMHLRNRAFAIYGEPIPTLDLLGDVVHRRTANFAYPKAPTLHVFDMDGWKIPPAMREVYGNDVRDKETVEGIVNALLENEGFGILASASKVIVLTSSCWDLQELYCHIYVNFSTPILVESMREFTTALAKIHQRKVFDAAMYKAVQPHFFESPECIGFKDPLLNRRIWYAEGLIETIPTEKFQEIIHKTLQTADWNPLTAKNNLPSIGKSWHETLTRFVDDERGINDPAHRAAAQLVQEVGATQVRSNINDYAKEMHDLTWESLVAKGCERGSSQKDKQTYTISRFRQYLQSALEKPFGDKVDRLSQQVREATNSAKEGNFHALTSKSTLSALAQLRTGHIGAYIPLEKDITGSRLLTKGDLQKLIKQASEDEGDDSELLQDDGSNFSENRLADRVLQRYEYVKDHEGNRYANMPGNGDGGYRMLRIDGNLVDVFFVDGCELSGNNAAPIFGRRVLSKLLGQDQKSNKSIFQKKLIGSRVVAEDQNTSTPSWVNIGMQVDGKYKSVKLEPGSATILTHQDSTPMWKDGQAALPIANSAEIAARFGPNADLTGYLLETLPKFIPTQEDSLLKAIMWIVAAYAQKTHAYIAELVGPAGAGKSTAADFMKDLVDPTDKILGTGGDRAMFRGVDYNFFAQVEKNYVTIIDNVSKLAAREQDTLCSLSTGLALSDRILYTQSQMERTIRRPIILTSLAPVVTRNDLRTRVITIEIEEPEFNPDFILDWSYEKPFLVSALLKLTAKTMKLLSETKKKPQDVSPRDVFISCVNSAIDGLPYVDFGFILNTRNLEAWDSAYDSRTVQLILAYLDDRDEDVVQLVTRDLHRRLKDWAQRNAGKQFGSYVVDMTDVPQTGRGLGWEIAKNMGTLKKVGDWDLSSTIKRSNGKVYIFTRKNLTTLDSLL